MDGLLERIEAAVTGGYNPTKKSLLINLYHEAFPLKERLKESCSSCGVDAFNKLLYLYNRSKISTDMAKNEYKLKGKTDEEIVVFPALDFLALKNENLNDTVIGMLKKKLGAEFDNHFEKVASVKAEK